MIDHEQQQPHDYNTFPVNLTFPGAREGPKYSEATAGILSSQTPNSWGVAAKMKFTPKMPTLPRKTSRSPLPAIKSFSLKLSNIP
jgi:hypothetical protein